MNYHYQNKNERTMECGRNHIHRRGKNNYYWVPRVQEAAKEHGIPFKVIQMLSDRAKNLKAKADAK